LANEVLSDEAWKDETNTWSFSKKNIKEECWRLIFFCFINYFLLLFESQVFLLFICKLDIAYGLQGFLYGSMMIL